MGQTRLNMPPNPPDATLPRANFDVEELPEVMAYLHERGVRGFVTMNVLVFDEELAQAEGLVKSIARSGVDAVIVQDVGRGLDATLFIV